MYVLGAAAYKSGGLRLDPTTEPVSKAVPEVVIKAAAHAGRNHT